MPSVWQRLADIVGSVNERTGVAGSLVNFFDPDNWLPGGKDAAFTLALIALSAKMAVADGVATASEHRAFKRTVEIPPAIETKALTKYYGESRGIDGIDLTVAAGEVFGFLGPNGAGKTTTIRLLLDLIRPTRGNARVLGLDVRKESLEVRRRSGYLPGELRLPDTPTARHYLEHLAFNGSENFPPGSLVPYFQSLGMTFGRDQNAFTNFDQTTYQLSLPDTKAETLGKGMTYFADVLYRLSLLPTEIDAERQIIQEERRRGLSGPYLELSEGSAPGRRGPRERRRRGGRAVQKG